MNRLQRQLSQLMLQQQQQAAPSTSLPSSPIRRHSSSRTISSPPSSSYDLPLDPASSLGDPHLPHRSPPSQNTSPIAARTRSNTSDSSRAVLLEALQSENAHLRHRLADAETNMNRQNQLNELYRIQLLNLSERSRTPGAGDQQRTWLPEWSLASPPGSGEEDEVYTDWTSGRRSRRESGNTQSGGSSGSSSVVGRTTSTGAVRIPGVAHSPPYVHPQQQQNQPPAQHHRTASTGTRASSSYSTSPSIASALSPSPSGSGSGSLSALSSSDSTYQSYPLSPAYTNTTTPSTSYTTPQVPASTPVNNPGSSYLSQRQYRGAFGGPIASTSQATILPPISGSGASTPLSSGGGTPSEAYGRYQVPPNSQSSSVSPATSTRSSRAASSVASERR